MDRLTTTYATLSDLETNVFQNSLTEARKWEKIFLDREPSIQGSDYSWPTSAVNNWGRIWEYPYAMNMIKLIDAQRPLKVIADFGPGVTFFPLWVSQLTNVEKIYTVDNDPVCVAGNERLRNAFVNQNSHKLHPVLSNGEDLGEIEDNSLDLLYSISVIEHIPNPENIIETIARKIAKNGFLIITLDVALRNDFGLKVKDIDKSNISLKKYFKIEGISRIAHLQDILTSINSPIQSEKRSFIGTCKGILKDIFNCDLRRSYSDYKLNICCFGYVLRKI